MLKAAAEDLPLEIEHKLTGTPVSPTLDTTYTAHYVENDMTAGGLNT